MCENFTGRDGGRCKKVRTGEDEGLFSNLSHSHAIKSLYWTVKAG